MGHSHTHVFPGESANRLRAALILTFLFLIAEVVASFLTGSLALLSDAGHMATDVAALAIALAAIHLGRRPADARRSYGYRRFEILAAALNAGVLFMAGAYILWEGVQRVIEPRPIAAVGMLVVAALGLIVNAAAMLLLRRGSSESLNVRAAYIEVWSDFIGSVAVLLGSAVIQFTGVLWIDPVLAILIALWVLPRAVRLLRAAMHVLLEGTPEGMDLADVEKTLISVSGVRAVRDLHVWSLTTGVPLLTAHVEIESIAEWHATLPALREALERDFHIRHVTLQPEVGCGDERGAPHCRT